MLTVTVPCDYSKFSVAVDARSACRLIAERHIRLRDSHG
jgi:hypothetical protein